MTDTTTDEPIETSAFEGTGPDDAHVAQVPPDAVPAPAAELVPHVPEQAIAANGAKIIPGTDLTVVPQMNELDVLAQMAVTIAAATTAPRALQGKPNDVFMVLLTARDLGVSLTTSIREFHVIDGKVTLSPKVRKAMVNQRGIGRIWADPDNDATHATWYGIRNDLPGVTSASTYTIEMAGRVKAKEGGQSITLAEKSTWQQYPERMLSWRALGYLLDDVFSEVGTGLYSPDELGAVTDEEGVPIIDVVGSSAPVRGTQAPRGHNAPPPPPPAMAAEKDLLDLRTRITRIRDHSPEARDAMMAMWTEDDGNGKPRLPPTKDLLAKQVTVARAVVTSVEARCKKGEWGEWNPADAPPAPGADDPAPTPTADATRAPAAPQGAEKPGRREFTPGEIEEFVKAMKPADLDLELTAAALATTGNVTARRQRLVAHLIAQETENIGSDTSGPDPSI